MSNVKLVLQDGKSEINFQLKNDTYYLYLPAYAQLDKCFFKLPEKYSIFINSELIEKNIGKIIKANNQEVKLELHKNDKIVCNTKLVVMQSEQIPTLEISLTDNSLVNINSNKEVSSSGTIRITDKDANVLYSGDMKKFHGRGNSTWYCKEKKPYKILLNDEADLLNMGVSKNWCLIANAIDISQLRNKIVSDFAQATDMSYNPQNEYVELYVDGEYLGLYLLAENVQVEENRVDIELKNQIINDTSDIRVKQELKNQQLIKWVDNLQDGQDITGGYLVEAISEDRLPEEWGTYSAFQLDEREFFKVSDPKYCSKNEIVYISDQFKNIKQHLLENDIGEYIDIDSWANYYLIQEIFGNTEQTSFFYYKDSDSVDNKIYAGPAWDFDIAVGSRYGWGDEKVNAEALYVATCSFYDQLYENPVFINRVKEIYKNKYRKILDNIVNKDIDCYVDYIQFAYMLDENRWIERDASDNNLRDSSNDIKNYLSDRKSYLDKIWVDNEELRSVCVEKPYPNQTKTYYSIQKGESAKKYLEDLSKYNDKEHEFEGWLDIDSGKFLEETEYTDVNRKYIAQWKITKENSSVDKLKNKLRTYKAEIAIISILSFVLIFLMIYSIKKKK